MCGIAGLLPRAGAVRSDLVPALWDLHDHRGPDDRGYLALRGSEIHSARRWDPRDTEADALLVHNRLSIIDVSQAGWQPMSSSDGRFHIVFNGEIYNYIELRIELQALGRMFRTTSDTEVLLQAYEEWGSAALRRLVGMFSFAVLDMARRVLVLARDFFGIKPMVYANGPEGFAFASSIPGVLEAIPSLRRADPEQVFRFMRFGSSDSGEQTMLRGIRHLPAAHYMEVPLDRSAMLRPVRYRSLEIAQPLDVPFDEASGLVRDAFMTNVDLHMRSDVPVGSCLSGGIDSSAIVMAMRELKGQDLDLHVFSYVSSDPRFSEERWIDTVGAASGAIIHKVSPDSLELQSHLEEYIIAQGEPAGSMSPLAQFWVFQAAREARVKVVLDGQGADEMLGGYVPLVAARLASLIRGGSVTRGMSLLGDAGSAGHNRKALVGHALRYLMPTALLPSYLRLVGHPLVPPWVNEGWMTEESVPVAEPPRIAERSLFRRALQEALRDTLPELLRYEDRNSMAHSVESRVPFLTPGFAELILSMPDDYLVSDRGVSKSVFREAMKGIVPQAVLDRRDKVGFAPSDRLWLTAVAPWVEERLRSEDAERVSPLNISYLRRHWRRMLSHGPVPDPGLWRALNLIEWARLFDVSFAS